MKVDSYTDYLTGIFIHCGLYDTNHDPNYPALYYRCVLLDSTWLVGLLTCFLWLAMFFVMWFSPVSATSLKLSRLHSHKYQIPDTQSKVEQPSLSKTCSLLSIAAKEKNLDTTTSPSTIISSPTTKRLERLTSSLMKALPPLHRESDDTLCLPIHSNATTTYNSSYAFDNDLSCESHQEKLQVSDIWNHSSLDCSSTDDHAHSLDLALMLSLVNNNVDDKNNNQIENEQQEDDENGAISRRLVIAHSCPEFNKKKMKTILNERTKTKDDTVLRY
ncbi:uncharacterized protein BX664DRAFT_334153 [Halteromyces radiatus]|uniref:uncharacterized protein n=1 Tax=Halteromyces radiatus TaxID=101107 RepID=UPI00221F75F2|nr:uncharacterized protein BX664DRAFT_334153 [Halteromyces radiatus]KAI8089886.1 hypothetical protein BX664DRAFT_334153 [Halteromyces radiatus]